MSKSYPIPILDMTRSKFPCVTVDKLAIEPVTSTDQVNIAFHHGTGSLLFTINFSDLERAIADYKSAAPH